MKLVQKLEKKLIEFTAIGDTGSDLRTQMSPSKNLWNIKNYEKNEIGWNALFIYLFIYLFITLFTLYYKYSRNKLIHIDHSTSCDIYICNGYITKVSLI